MRFSINLNWNKGKQRRDFSVDKLLERTLDLISDPIKLISKADPYQIKTLKEPLSKNFN
jgi:hypothetical protein